MEKYENTEIKLKDQNKHLKKWLIITICIIIFLVFILVPLVMGNLKRDAEMQNLPRQHAQKVEKYNEENKTAKHGQLMFLGNSLIEFYDTENAFFQYESYNRGISGDKTRGILDRLDDNVLAINPSVVVLEIGTNDIGSEVGPTRLLENLEQIIARLQGNGSEVVLISLLPVNKSFFHFLLYGNNRTNAKIMSMNEKYKAMSEKMNFHFVDAYNSLLDDNNKLSSDYSNDGLHLTEAGYKVLTLQIAPVLEKVYQETTTVNAA